MAAPPRPSMMATMRPDPPEPTLTIWICFAAMAFGNFMSLLDVQIVASSIGDIQSGVGASRDEISWVQTSYLIAEVIAIPLSGFLGRALGVRLLFTIAAAGFAFMSAMCALSWDLPSLIVFRSMQGFIGGALVPTTMSMAFLVFPQRHQPLSSTIVGLVSTLGPTMGPTLGGWIAETWDWRWLFWINVIPGITIATIVWNNLKMPGPNWTMLKAIDFIGLIGLASMLGSAQYVLEEGPKDGWDDPTVLGLMIVSVVGGIVFFTRALSRPIPIVDPILPPAGIVRGGRKLLLAVGRLEHQKGTDRLIDAFALLASAHPDWDLVILGEGAERKSLTAQIHRAGLADRVLMPGQAGNVGEWYARADLYVLPSRFEGFPNTLAEAMAHGLAAVAFDCDTGPRDIIRHDRDGLLVPPGDVPALAAALERLMGDAALRERFAAAAIATRDRYSEAAVLRQWESLFRELVR